MSPAIEFHLTKSAPHSRARLALLNTPHAQAATPIFMPVATNAAVRGQHTSALHELAFPVLLANTYHLLLRPGVDVFRRFGGIHRFMQWKNAVLTDSGGFQLFSLTKFIKLSEEGAEFRSYVDGQKILLSPEESIRTQQAIGSDIMMALDHCIPSTSTHAHARDALLRTQRWAKRSLAQRIDNGQALFGIVQGACFPELRKESAAMITDLAFDGFAIGGLAVGEGREEREAMTELTAELLPKDKPRYLMGVGTPIDLLEAVHRGVDLFDCILPTALGQQGVCYTSHGKIDLRRGVYKFSDAALDQHCPCETCRTYSRGYLHHLIKVGEYFGGQLAGAHNLHFYSTLMRTVREAIAAGSFYELYRRLRTELVGGDEENPSTPPKRKSHYPVRELGNFEVVERSAGVGAIRQRSSGEVMHLSTVPLDEARQLYVTQAALEERLLDQSSTEALVLWDVGLGAATNAMSAVLLYEALMLEQKSLRPLQIVSFECDLDALRLALLHPRLFSHVRHAAPVTLLNTGLWKGKAGLLSWELIDGDFLTTLTRAPAPEVIFFDPFSYKSDRPLWTLDSFKKIYACYHPRGTALFNYSASTAVRATLLAAGFYVARGAATGAKSETTIALTHYHSTFDRRYELLGSEWLQRWKRSDAQAPNGLSEEERRYFLEAVVHHRQFTHSV